MSLFALAVSAASAAPVEGTWRAPDADHVAADVRAAVDTALSASFSAPERPVARWVLLRATRPCRTVEVEVRDAALAIRCDEQVLAVAPTDGTPVPYRGADGRALTLVHALLDERTVTQSFATPEGTPALRAGTRTNRLTLRPDGTLQVAVTIRSQRLSGPLEYSLTYAR